MRRWKWSRGQGVLHHSARRVTTPEFIRVHATAHREAVQHDCGDKEEFDVQHRTKAQEHIIRLYIFSSDFKNVFENVFRKTSCFYENFQYKQANECVYTFTAASSIRLVRPKQFTTASSSAPWACAPANTPPDCFCCPCRARRGSPARDDAQHQFNAKIQQRHAAPASPHTLSASFNAQSR